MADRHRSSEEIRAEIERTRADMDETVQQIGYKLSPGQIVDQLFDRVRTGDAAESVMEVVKNHPMPSLLVGLGLSWLVYEKTSQTEGERLRRKYGDDIGPGTYAPAEGRVGPYRGEELGLGHGDDSGLGERVHDAVASARHGASSAAAHVGDAAASVKHGAASAASKVRESVAGAVSGAREGLRSAAEHAGERMDTMRTSAGERAAALRSGASEKASQYSTRVRDTTTRAYDEQPLALGAVAFGLGLASGLAVPSTRFEDRAMGERSDRIKDEVRRTGSEALEGAKRVASEAQHAARESISRHGVVDELKSKAKMVAQEAKQAAMDAVQRDGVADTLKNRVRTIAQDTRTAAMQAAEREGLDAQGLKDRARESTERIRE